ncbi:hypothetical protein J1N35_038302 [Gossypium stocksii]|uniref:Uncharacterized protein n=1 Tax=Gossypium stocksii TaxID=47602 RepID=A0A9D3ULI2_9ROSI|nr:hypothetical protein J1N35_038302 [Gossypium stocksii]
MIADIILSTVKVSTHIELLVLIANIHSQYQYTPTYYKVWVAKQKAFGEIASRVLDRYVPGSVTNLEMHQDILAIRRSLGNEYSTGSFGPLSNVQRHFNTDDNQNILPIVFAITPGEMIDD